MKSILYSILISCSFLSIIACKSRMYLKDNNSLKLNRNIDHDFFVGYILSKPKLTYMVQDELPDTYVRYHQNRHYITFKFKIIDQYVTPYTYNHYRSNSKIMFGNELDTLVEVRSIYRDSIITIYYATYSKSNLRKLRVCYDQTSIIMLGYLNNSTFYSYGNGFTTLAYNFKPQYLDSLLPVRTYRMKKPLSK